MKSVERHKLETNWLAKHLKTWIDDIRPHVSTIAGVTIAIALVVIAWSWINGTSAERENQAWDVYNAVVGSRALNQESLTQLNRATEEYQGTDMVELAKVTWADGLVWSASLEFLQNRAAAMESLNRASSAYQATLDTTSDARLIDRSHFGLARVYELRNEPDKAREEYLKVTGSFARMAKLRADELAKEKTKETLDWLATAEAPKLTAPLGGGTPGQRPIFNVDDFSLPDAAGGTSGAGGATSLEELFQGINQLGIGTSEAKERYPADGAAPSDATTEGKSNEGDEKSAADAATPPADAKAAEADQPADTDDKSEATSGPALIDGAAAEASDK